MPAAAMAPDAPPPPLEAELNLINLPTTMSLKTAQELFPSHPPLRTRPAPRRFGTLAEDLFSLDNGAIIGLEYRFGDDERLQAGVHRSILSKTIETFGRWDALRQQERRRCRISLLGSVEGQDNLQQNSQPASVRSLSRAVGHRLTPLRDADLRRRTRTRRQPASGARRPRTTIEAGDDRPTRFARGRNAPSSVWGCGCASRPTIFVVAEISPRI